MEIILVLYFSILIGIGVAASKKVNNVRDYYVGGKKLNYWIAALSARATGESGWLLLGVSGMGAVMGFSAFWIVLGEPYAIFSPWSNAKMLSEISIIIFMLCSIVMIVTPDNFSFRISATRPGIVF